MGSVVAQGRHPKGLRDLKRELTENEESSLQTGVWHPASSSQRTWPGWEPKHLVIRRGEQSYPAQAAAKPQAAHY